MVSNIATGDIVQLVDGGTATTIEKQSAVVMTQLRLIWSVSYGCSYTDPNTKQKFSHSFGQQALLHLMQWRL
jgi:hypothetical protein